MLLRYVETLGCPASVLIDRPTANRFGLRLLLDKQGKLGIVIDTTLEGPVVHKISSESPLEGIIFPGDIIVAINDVDTRAMSASAITALMARTATSRRVLTVLSEDVSN